MKYIYKNKLEDGNKCIINRKVLEKIKEKTGWINMIKLLQNINLS